MKRLSADLILAIAAKREFCVHAYRWSDERLRKQCRRMAKDGLLTVRRRQDQFVYRAVPHPKADSE